MVLPLGTDHNEIAVKLETYGIPEQLKGAVELLLQFPVMNVDTCPPHLLSMLVQAHMCTWFTVKEIPRVAQAGSGSRPGTSLADFVFSVLYAKTLTTIRTYMRQEGILTDFASYKAAGQIHPLVDTNTEMDTTYADDSGFYVMVTDNNQIIATTKKLIVCIHNGLRQYALSPSYDKGKSQVLISYRGEGHRAAKYQIMHDYAAELQVDEIGTKITFVHQAKHLGGMLESSGDMGPEIRYRQGETRQASTPLRHSLYTYREI